MLTSEPDNGTGKHGWQSVTVSSGAPHSETHCQMLGEVASSSRGLCFLPGTAQRAHAQDFSPNAGLDGRFRGIDPALWSGVGRQGLSHRNQTMTQERVLSFVLQGRAAHQAIAAARVLWGSWRLRTHWREGWVTVYSISKGFHTT